MFTTKNIHNNIMKQTFIIIAVLTGLVCTAMLTSCDVNIRTKDYRDSEKWGRVTTDTLELKPFTGIVVNAAVDIVLVQGEKMEVVVEGNENAIDEYSYTVEDDELEENASILVVDVARRLNYNLPSVRLHIVTPNIENITLNGSSDFDIKDSLTVGHLNIEVNGSGDIDIRQLKVQSAFSIHLHGSGDVTVRDLECQYLTAEVNGSGDADLRNVRYADETELVTNGSGDIDATITGHTITATAQGSGDIDLEVDCDELTISSQGAGDVEIKGNTKVLRRSSTMLGTTTTKKLKAEKVIIKE